MQFILNLQTQEELWVMKERSFSTNAQNLSKKRKNKNFG